MNRDYDLTLAAATTWYNLWDLIIANEIALNPNFDRTFSNSPYIPSMVCELTIQSDLLANGGMAVTLGDKTHRGGINLSGGQADANRASTNCISIKDKEFRSDTAGALLHVHIEAR